MRKIYKKNNNFTQKVEYAISNQITPPVVVNCGVVGQTKINKKKLKWVLRSNNSNNQNSTDCCESCSESET